MKHPIITIFSDSRNPEIAKQQEAYMKGRCVYFGLKTTFRRALQKTFLLKSNLPSKAEAFVYIKDLWGEPQRELHYFAQELLFKYIKVLDRDDLSFIEWLIVRNSWWDTIDFLAPKILAAYFKLFPEERRSAVDRWLDSGNIWLQRSALLFQLKYKEETDLELLEEIILELNSSKEFFIKKAIGWILRENSRLNTQWVIDFVAKHELQPLSKKEALRLIPI